MPNQTAYVHPVNFRYLTDRAEVADALKVFEQSEIVSLDSECFWQDGRTRVSLVQLSTEASPETLVIDVMQTGVEVLRPLVEDANVVLLAHNASFDRGLLAAAGLNPAGFVDTLRLARRALRLPSYSLANVSQELCGISLDKSWQRSNWRQRPLLKAQLYYAALDAHVTLEIYQRMAEILRERGDFEDAFDRAKLDAPKEGAPRRNGVRRRAPQVEMRPLTEAETRTVARLKSWRLNRSDDLRTPAYMICPDATLVHLAQVRPQTVEDLTQIHGLGESKIKRFGEEILEVLAISD